mgnify:CR=1 FL=1
MIKRYKQNDRFQLLINDVEEKYKLRDAEETCENILKIEKSIMEIRNLFNELSFIVDLQQEKIQQIEHSVDVNLHKVEKGRKKIISANKKKSKIRRVSFNAIKGLF